MSDTIILKKKKPVILCTAGTFTRNERRFLGIHDRYVDAIELAGGIAIVPKSTTDDQIISSLLEIADGVLFTGGDDIDPRFYGEVPHPKIGEIEEEIRDLFEIELFKKAFELKKPILGICRGAQLINVALGGTLYQDIPAQLDVSHAYQKSEDRESPIHDIEIEKDSLLEKILGVTQAPANSLHHQSIKDLGTGLRISARSSDGGLLKGLS
jgi:putative glutamine amidotransferase